MVSDLMKKGMQFSFKKSVNSFVLINVPLFCRILTVLTKNISS